MTCSGCESKVKQVIGAIEDVQEVEVSLLSKEVIVTSSRTIALSEISKALPEKYTVETNASSSTPSLNKEESWLSTYKLLGIIFGYIIVLSMICALKSQVDAFMVGMNTFMAGFFLIFSFFKMLDLRGFADSYAMYDVVAKKWSPWGYIYAFIELLLGLSYALDCCPMVTNIITLIVMSISLIGVIDSNLKKQKIKCACLGTIFNLPMSTVTIIEDGLMMIMSGIMLYLSL